MTPRQQRFVDEYLVDLNATQAAIRAGYSERTARSIACTLLTNVNVAAAIAARKQAMQEQTGITRERVVAELAKIGFCNMSDYMRTTKDGDPVLDFSALTRDQTAALQEVTVDDYIDGRGDDARAVKRVKFKLADKRAALVDLGRHLGLFVDRKEVTGKDGGPIEHNVTTPGTESLLRRVRARLDAAAGAGPQGVDAQAHPDGSVLPAAVCAGPGGHGTPVDAGAHSGSAT